MKSILLFVPVVLGLQVAPNSPCSAACIDNASLDPSDPNSSNTNTTDIVCPDGAYESSDTGRKFKTCLSCLQNSTFAQGAESDQAWFIYNLRFAFDTCILKSESNPCLTPEACGHASSALTGDLHAASSSFCDADGGVFTNTYTSCLQCVQSDETHSYLANFLTALDAFCIQKPAPSLLLGLNETVFSHNAISITDPAAPHAQKTRTTLSTAAIAGIVVGVLIVLALVAGCVYMQLRKRRNKAKRSHCRPEPPVQVESDDERFFADEKNLHSAEVVSMSPVARSKPVPWNVASASLNVETGVPAVRDASPRSAASSASNKPLVKHKASWTSSPVSPASSFASPALQHGGFERRMPGSPSMTRIQTSFAPPPRR